MICGDSIRVVHPLFQTEGGGSTPTSPLQLRVGRISVDLAIALNDLWHSRLPFVNKSNIIRNKALQCFGAEYGNLWFASAIWTSPVSATFVDKSYLELRRFAIASDAPKNTASRLLGVMVRLLRRSHPLIERFISYQDTDVHSGTIYSAAGWSPVGWRKGGDNVWSTNHRLRNSAVATGDKVRWELCADNAMRPFERRRSA